jgi:hypothetical protein
MRRFCGLPIGLSALPVVTATARVNNRSFGDIFCFLEMFRTIGVPIIARVSFMSMADKRPIGNKMRRTM